MTPLALAPPLTEPVTLAEARQFLRLDQHDEDELLATLITAARLMIEAAAGRCLIEQPWRIVLDRWPASGEIRLPLSPIARVQEARVYDALGVAQPVAATALTLDRNADPPLIRVNARCRKSAAATAPSRSTSLPATERQWQRCPRRCARPCCGWRRAGSRSAEISPAAMHGRCRAPLPCWSPHSVAGGFEPWQVKPRSAS